MMSQDIELTASPGFVEPAVHAEFPGLGLAWLAVAVRPRATPRSVKQRLRHLSNRVGGATVVAMRTQPIPRAYRTFYRQVGLDPDATRIPSEEAAVNRLLQGGFRSTGLLSDALLISLVETGVPVWALRAELVDPSGLGIRTSVPGDHLGSIDQPLAPGRLAVADARLVHAMLFGPVAPGHEPDARSRGMVLFAVGVPGVPVIHLEEALWICQETLAAV